MVDGYLTAVILGLVEGITEFLPISSTGHLIVAGSVLGFEGERAKTFEIFIQLGAILAILWIYRSRFRELVQTAAQSEQSRRFIGNLAIAFLPAAVVGLIFHRQIKQYLFGPIPVAWALLVGGLVMLLIERLKPVSQVSEATGISPRQALGVGLAQVLSLFPGVSRSGATIMYHCKVMIVDDCWTSVGSTNFDNRSFRLNDEANLNILDGGFARAESNAFDQDIAHSIPVTLESWRRRPWTEKLAERFAALLRSQL